MSSVNLYYKKGFLSLLQRMFMLVYIIIAIFFLNLVAIPYLEASNLDVAKLFADSITYLDICKDSVSWDNFYWLRDAGPCLEVSGFERNYYLVFLFNFLLVFLAIKTLAFNYSLRFSSLAFFVLINPITFLSLFSINKEVLGLYAVSLTLSFIKSPYLKYAFLALFFSAMARLPMFLAIFVFFTIYYFVRSAPGISLVKFGRLKIFLIVIFFVSVVRVLLGEGISDDVLGNVSESLDNSTSTQFSLSIEWLANIGLYGIVYIIRLSINFFGAIPNFFYATLSSHGVYYFVGVIGSSFVFLFYILWAFFSGLRNICSTQEMLWIELLFLVYSTIFCISPVIQHRYFYPLLPIFLVAIARKKISN